MNAQAPAAIIEGALVDAKNVAAHKCVRLSIDVPAELGAQIVKAFGWPTMAEPVHVAVARLNVGTVVGPHKDEQSIKFPKQSKRFEDMPYATQAALTCQEPRFHAYLREERFYECDSEDEAANFVREFCLVGSRSEIKPDNPKAASRWQFLISAYQGWKAAERAGA